jgi:hypothetical protein
MIKSATFDRSAYRHDLIEYEVVRLDEFVVGVGVCVCVGALGDGSAVS